MIPKRVIVAGVAFYKSVHETTIFNVFGMDIV